MSNFDNLRVSEADREEASARLAEHYSTGRLSDDDYYERLDAVWSARIRADLEMLFTDLPKSTPQPPQAVRRPRGRPRPFPLIACFLLVAIGLMVMGVPWWVFAAIAGGALVFHKKHHHSHHHSHRHHHHPGCAPR